MYLEKIAMKLLSCKDNNLVICLISIFSNWLDWRVRLKMEGPQRMNWYNFDIRFLTCVFTSNYKQVILLFFFLLILSNYNTQKTEGQYEKSCSKQCTLFHFPYRHWLITQLWPSIAEWNEGDRKYIGERWAVILWRDYPICCNVFY